MDFFEIRPIRVKNGTDKGSKFFDMFMISYYFFFLEIFLISLNLFHKLDRFKKTFRLYLPRLYNFCNVII